MPDLFDLPFEAPEPDPELEVRETAPGERPTPSASERRVVTVTELTAAIREALESRLFEVWVEGEISNCKVWNTGHMYLNASRTASIAMWKQSAGVAGAITSAGHSPFRPQTA